MRNAILIVAAISLFGCHKSYKTGFKKLGSNMAKVGGNIAAVAKKAVPIKADINVDVKADLAAMAKQQVQQQIDTRVASSRIGMINPITISKSVKRVDRGEPAPAPAQTVEPVITRTTVNTGADQIFKNTWRQGEKATCEKVDTFESCQSTCSDILRGESMRQLDPKAGKPMQCECTQGYSKCQ